MINDNVTQYFKIREEGKKDYYKLFIYYINTYYLTILYSCFITINT